MAGMDDRIRVETVVNAPVELVWQSYTRPDDIMAWNAASDDWHTTRAHVDLREGGDFVWRMEAKDGSMGFDFAGTYTRVERPHHLEYDLGERPVAVSLTTAGDATQIVVEFEADNEYPHDQQKAGWQAILDNFKRHVEHGTQG